MPDQDVLAERLILDALRQEAARRALVSVLLIGIQAGATVGAANAIVGSERLVLLHLDRATDAYGLGLGNHEMLLGQDLGPLAPFGLVGLNVGAAKSYRLLREVVAQTARLIAEDGAVLVAGPRRGGAEVAARVLRERFESVELVAYRKGERIYRAARPCPPSHAEPGAPPAAPEHAVEGQARPEIATVTVRGCSLRLLQDERIFAKGRIDPATRLLAEAFAVEPGAAILDLGSGSGVLGILAALLEPSSRVVLVDSDPLAVAVSRQNAALNGAANVAVHLSDVLADLPDERFDLVLMNPPFHRGRAQAVALGERFIQEASQMLRPGGTMYVVCNRFLRYEPTLGLLGPVREVAGDRQYKVLLARRRR
jgi:16S rRNA (guanine1207-N2)-methyltransferase